MHVIRVYHASDHPSSTVVGNVSPDVPAALPTDLCRVTMHSTGMSHPEIVEAALDDEPVAAEVPLGGDDVLYVTPTRTLIFRAEGLLSDESVEEYPHDAERVTVSEGRRKSKVALDYGLEGEKTFSMPTKRIDQALHPVLAGVLNAADITDAGETVKQTFRFSELTLVVTSARLVKHIGAAVWDEDYEEFHFEDVTDLGFEDGSVATSIVLTIGGGRQERFKTPNDDARAVKEALESALLAYHDAPSLEAFRESMASETVDESPREDVSFGEGLDPLSTNPGELTDEPTNATRSPDSADEAPAAGDGQVDDDALTAGDNRDGSTVEAATAATDVTGTSAVDAADATGETSDDAAGATDPDGTDARAGGDRSPADTAALAETLERPPDADPVEDPTAGADSTADATSGPEPTADATSGPEPTVDAGTEATPLREDDGDFADTGFESAASLGRKELAAELAALREVVEAQGQQLQRQNELIDQLIAELRQGR